MWYNSPVMGTRQKHVVVALRMATIAGQDKLSGIFEYLADKHCWRVNIYRLHHEFTAKVVRDEVALGADGFIVGTPESTDAIAELAKTDLPVVLMNTEPGPLARHRAGCIHIQDDSQAIGREAARAFLTQGIYKSYGYVGYRLDEDWSRARGNGYRDALEKADFIGRMFDVPHFKESTEDRATLIGWLKSLPKPCGILAACDDRAYEVVAACNAGGLRIPAEVGILGIGNDPQTCENVEPRLSSVQPDSRREGYLAAQHLDRLMRKKRQTADSDEAAKTIFVGVRQVAHRESTYPISNSGILVQKALAFIAAHGSSKLSVDDVARHLKISRPLLDLRFRELQHETVHDVILRTRMDEVKKRLLTTEDTIERISTDCGWTNVNSLKNAFRRATGVSMRDFRRGKDRA